MIQKSTPLTKQTAIILSNSAMKGPGLRLEVLSFWMNRTEQGIQFISCKLTPNFPIGPLFNLALIL